MQLHINTYGTYLHVKDEMFEIRVPESEGSKVYKKHHFAAKKVKSILMAKAAALSTDAVFLALKFNVDIIFVEFDGKPAGRVWHSKLGSTTKIRKCQLEASLNKQAVKWVKEWIVQKIENQVEFLKDLKKHRESKKDYLDEKIEKINKQAISIAKLEAESIAQIAETIRGIEGTAGRYYFSTLSKLLAKEYQFEGRSSRPALDPFNAFLNYAYGMLYGKVEKSLIIAGIDPYLGFMHRDDYNQLSMVYDFIEPYRIHVDRTVFKLFSAKKVNQTHTDKIKNGYTLNEMGKKLLVENFNNYFEEETHRYRGRNQTRANALQMDAHTFANTLINKNQINNDNVGTV
ncbi:MAG: CRISPR-associated endonuclease Cas1 [Chitinophagaceae bacterium]|nr:MAG: CRISPR-associated endonuclease Cas1 [Chitinophagaceae bacterium]